MLVVLGTVFAAAAQAVPSSPTDESKVPHYFGPYPNWANSPMTTADAKVTITGDGAGATADATVGANGAITALNLTNPGHDYTNATVDIAGSGSGASATAIIRTTSSVTGIAVGAGGARYVKPSVAITGGGANPAATAHALGGVEAVTLDQASYPGYTFPTVDFDLPDDPNGIQAKGHAICAAPQTDCKPATAGGTVTVTGVALDSPGSGYTSAPGVAVLDGTQFDPVNHDPGKFTQATGQGTLKIDSIAIDTPGAGYTSKPTVDITDPNGTGASATATIDVGAIAQLNLTSAGSGYVTGTGIKKFEDSSARPHVPLG